MEVEGNQLNQLNLLIKWLPIYYRFEETVGITLNQIRLGSVFIYLFVLPSNATSVPPIKYTR